MESLLQPDRRVLSTLNDDGSRRWIRPRPSHGPFYRRRRAVAYGLIALFVALPYVRINGKPAVLLDILHREFTLFGRTFLPTDTLLLALLIVGVFTTVFFVTALLGRVWCGWACPQTVYMEFLFRPIERLLEGEPGSVKRPAGWKRPLKLPAYLVLSMMLAHVFLAYFVGVDTLMQWVRQSPVHHPVPFLVMAFVTALMMFDFSFFREQMCIIACPYGRMQSVMLDRGSLIVAYDRQRGEPRGKAKKAAGVSLRVLADAAGAPQASAAGDCVDCLRCVATCPTGIDIRDGLQMECIACTQCIDACDDVMTRLKRPTGLIRYASQRSLDNAATRRFRPRLLIYPAVMTLVFGGLVTLLLTASPVDLRLLRGRGQPFVVETDGRIAGTVQLKLTNRAAAPATYAVTLTRPPQGEVHLDENPVTLKPGELRTLAGTLRLRAQDFGPLGTCPVQIQVAGPDGFARTLSYTALGPAGKGNAQ
ncbi:MAG: cytochrome c oxidase accessory protein CcoG [Thermoleophilia bacterium]|nr:cytochrome c oxidase accessory protein CcoG [Thermoleophilia bacterium]